MAFYQNNNTSTVLTLYPPLTTGGIDSLIGVATTWDDFVNPAPLPGPIPNPVHNERKKAFKEFVFLMFYHRNRKLEGTKFPHNVLFEKVLKFFVETAPGAVSTTPGVPSGMPVPTNSSGTPIFVETSAGSDVYDPDSGLTTVADKTPVLRGESGTPVSSTIKLEIDIALATGNTTVGFFQEVATLFAHFYLFRQLTILNGHLFEFTNTLLADPPGPNYKSLVISRDLTDDQYDFNPATVPWSPPSRRTAAIITEIDKPESELPFYFNSLMIELRDMGFQIPNTNLSTTFPSPLTPPYANIDHDKMFLAYFVKMLDPVRPVGITTIGAGTNAIVSTAALTKNVTTPPNLVNKNAMVNSPITAIYQDEGNSNNTFIEDLHITIRSGNGIADVGGAGLPFGPYSSFPPRPFFVNATGLTFSGASNIAETNAIVKYVYDKIGYTTQRALQQESNFMLSCFLGTDEYNSENTILASGVGEISVSILGLRNFGLPFFNYKMEANTNISRDKSESATVELNKKKTIHIGAYALDHGSNPSDLKITVTCLSGIEKYTFKLQPEPTSTTGDMLIVPDSIPYPSTPPTTGVDFYNVLNSATNVWSYYKSLPRRTSLGVGSVPELIAEYDVNSRELSFREFTEDEIGVYDFSALYGSSDSKNIEYEVTSKVTSPGGNTITEELLSLISIYNNIFPGIVSDDALYDNDTFQLFDTSGSSLTLNPSSYSNLLSTRNEERGVELIFNLIKLSSISVSFLPPELKGGYVGQIPISGSGIGTSSSSVISDQNYSPKFGSSLDEERDTSPPEDPLTTALEISEYEAVKYSWGRIVLTQSPTYPAVPTEVDVKLEITSFVNDSVSHLETEIDSGATTLLDSKKVSGATNNQVLAMLRSFGLLEGLVEKMKTMITDPSGSAEEVAILNKLNEWLPASGTPEADLIICSDDDSGGAVVLAGDVTLNDYYTMKKY